MVPDGNKPRARLPREGAGRGRRMPRAAAGRWAGRRGASRSRVPARAQTAGLASACRHARRLDARRHSTRPADLHQPAIPLARLARGRGREVRLFFFFCDSKTKDKLLAANRCNRSTKIKGYRLHRH